MTLSDISIRRPVFTWMMILALLTFGLLGYARLGVDQFPNMEFPVVTVDATLAGAAPEMGVLLLPKASGPGDIRLPAKIWYAVNSLAVVDADGQPTSTSRSRTFATRSQ